MKIKPRGWQKLCFTRMTKLDKKSFLLDVTPGSGKTIYSAISADHYLQSGDVDFVICVVPTTALKGDSDAGFLGDYNRCGVQLTTVLKEGRGCPKQYQGAVITYAQLPNIVSTFETWSQNGMRLMFVFDEVHHASEANVWGAAASKCESVATRILSMTGTAFRGDGQRISFVDYHGKGAKDSDGNDLEGTAKHDFKYKYGDAVRDRVCRELIFVTDDGIAEYIYQSDSPEEVRISEANQGNEGKVKATVFGKDSEWLKTTIDKADACLEEYRITDENAGGIIICRPGTDDNDDRHMMQVAKLVRKMTGDDPIVITHDDPDANAKIERFRKSRDKWIVSVRKISEGVDIKRLRVMLLATKPGTELLFRQLAGRVVRHEDATRAEDATVFLAKFPQLVQWAESIQDEARAALRSADDDRQREASERTAPVVDFVPLGATHEDGGAISDFGETFTSAEITFAESIKRGDRELIDLSVTKIAHLLRRLDVQVDPQQKPEPPLQVQKKELRQQLNNLTRQAAIRLSKKNGQSKPDFQSVWYSLSRQLGVKNIDDLIDNHSIDKCRQAIELVKASMVDMGDTDAA